MTPAILAAALDLAATTAHAIRIAILAAAGITTTGLALIAAAIIPWRTR